MATNNSSNPSIADIDSIYCRNSNSSIISQSRLTLEIVKDAKEVKHEVRLKRHLGLFSGICFIVGMIIGSGIFVSPKGVLRETQSVGLCLITWVGCGLVSLLGALCYAEIGGLIPKSGAEIAYMKEGIGSLHQQTGEILAYLYSWSSAFILRPASIAVLTLTSSQYLLFGIMNECGPSEQAVKLTAIFFILLLINVNCFSVSIANRIGIIFTISKVVTILTVIIFGFIRLGQGHTQNLQNGFSGTTKNPLGVAIAFYAGLWAYDGWNSLNSITEELKNPKRNLWLSIVLAIPATTILYLLTNISYFTVMNKSELLNSKAVALTWGEVTLGPVVRFLPILIAISALGTANGTLFSAARYCMTGARYGYLPEIFACIQKKRLTPVAGILIEGLIGIVLCIPSNIDSLIGFFSFTAWIFYGLTFLATLFCKFTMKTADRVISIPIPLIILIILISIYLIIAPVITDPSIGYLIASLLILIGLVFYYPFVYLKKEINFIKRLNTFLIHFFQLQHAEIHIL